MAHSNTTPVSNQAHGLCPGHNSTHAVHWRCVHLGFVPIIFVASNNVSMVSRGDVCSCTQYTALYAKCLVASTSLGQPPPTSRQFAELKTTTPHQLNKQPSVVGETVQGFVPERWSVVGTVALVVKSDTKVCIVEHFLYRCHLQPCLHNAATSVECAATVASLVRSVRC